MQDKIKNNEFEVGDLIEVSNGYICYITRIDDKNLYYKTFYNSKIGFSSCAIFLAKKYLKGIFEIKWKLHKVKRFK